MISNVYIFDDIVSDQEKILLHEYCLENEKNFKFIKNITYDDDGESYLPAWVLSKKIHKNIHEKIEELQKRVCEKIGVNLMKTYRFKINLTKPFELKEEEEKNLIHVDRFTEHIVLIYYVNDTDGDTVILSENEITKIKPKMGRIVVFDGKYKHYGLYPESGKRFIFNVNFVATGGEVKKKLL